MTHQVNTSTQDLLQFLSDNSEGLQNAALLLGGKWALKRVQHMIDFLAMTQELTRRVRSDLVALHELFSLKYVGDPERIETVLFAEIDPADPMVEEICLLTDKLKDHMQSIDAAADLPLFELDLAA